MNHQRLTIAPKRSRWEQIVLDLLENFDSGLLRIKLPSGQFLLIGANNHPTKAELFIKDERFFQYCVVYGDFGLGLAYERGFWESEKPEETLEWFRRNTLMSSGQSEKSSVIRFLRVKHKIVKKHALTNLSSEMEVSNRLFSYFPKAS